MQVLTPSGYQSPAALANGAEVCAFDAETSAPIVNHVENIDVVDYAEWCRWWQVEETIPAFIWVRINGTFLLFREQSIWRNGTNVCHAKHLVVGDEIYDDADQPVPITSLEPIVDETLIWYRFDISGDHSYIIDGLTVHNASRVWVGGTGNLDGSTTTHIASTSGGTGGASYPTSADALAFDASSGGGVVTVTADVNLSSITMGAFTGTLDFSANNNNVTLGSFSGSGSGTRTLNMGNGTWTVTGSSWNMLTTSNLTFNANSSVLEFTGAVSPNFTGGSVNYNIITVWGSASKTFNFNGASSIGTLNIHGPRTVILPAFGVTTTVSTLNILGSSGLPVLLKTSDSNSATLSVASNAPTISWAGIVGIACTGGAVFAASNSLDFGFNSGITITPPSVGGGSSGFGVIGS